MSKDEKAKKRKVCLASLLVLPFSLLIFAAEILRVVEKVRTGHGLDYYTTFEGYQFNYTGALVGYIAISLLMILAPLIYWIGSKEERDFKSKYGISDK